MHQFLKPFLVVTLGSLYVGQVVLGSPLEEQLSRAGKNASELRKALDTVPDSERTGMEFLISHMPERDLQSLSSEFLLENVSLAYQAWRGSPWSEEVSDEVFLNNVLPYASINERRDRWRAEFYDKFVPLVQNATSPGEAAAILNNKLFKQLSVRYSTKRTKADQSPYESIESGLASCTGLSVLLIDACRAVGVPARFVGTPSWSDRSGNHSWVEVWDDGWHYTGAAEPTGMQLDEGWFAGRAAKAKREDMLLAIYATSFRRTPLHYPCVWDPKLDYISAVNVTDSYTKSKQELPQGHGLARIRVHDDAGRRIGCVLKVMNEQNEVCFTGITRDERFDANDHFTISVAKGQSFRATVEYQGKKVTQHLRLDHEEQLFTIDLDQPKAKSVSASDPIAALKAYLSTPSEQREEITDESFATVSLTKQQANEARELLWDDHTARIKRMRTREIEARVLEEGELKMPFAYKIFGEKPPGGRSLYISMHGGGGAPKQVNNQQWQNQQRLYEPPEGVYLAPRAPTDTWNLWHQSHIDRLFDRLIENLIVFEDVDPNRVYLMGYSAGGDGAYQLAPRMADRWAAVSMMAGHPNDTSPLGLRNIGFAIYMGGRDVAYRRNEIAAEWKEKLSRLQEEDQGGYRHQVTIYPNKGHWMDGKDASSIDWMREQKRNPLPKKVIWKQDDVTHERFYWLATDHPKAGALVIAIRDGATINLQTEKPESLSIRLSDEMLDLDEPVRITCDGRVLYEGLVSRTIATLLKTLAERGDRSSVFSSEVQLTSQQR